MNKIYLTLVIALTGYTSYAQNNRLLPTGSAGVGTSNPVVLFHIL